jgi:hypothetical protein
MGLSRLCCMRNVRGTVHPQLLVGEVLPSLYVYKKTWWKLGPGRGGPAGGNIIQTYQIHKPEKNMLVLLPN